MLQRLFSLMKKDMKLVTRNWFLLITLFIALVFILLVNFVIPQDINMEPQVFVLTQTKDPALQAFGQGLSQKENGQEVSDRQTLEKHLNETSGSIGMVLSGTSQDPQVEFLLQGYENEKVKAILLLEMKDYLGHINGKNDTRVSYVGKVVGQRDIPFNHSLLPLFLLMEPVLLGLFFIATLMFFEKSEGTTKAYVVSPGRMKDYLLSKVLVMFLLGLMSMYLVTFLTIGFNANLGLMFVIALAGSLFGSGLGLFISSYFDNLSKAMIWIISFSLLLSLPFASYYMPNFSPIWIRIMPTYSLLFALKECVYQTGQVEVVWQAILTSGVLGILLFGGSVLRYKKNLV